jgi:hypothetical protein
MRLSLNFQKTLLLSVFVVVLSTQVHGQYAVTRQNGTPCTQSTQTFTVPSASSCQGTPSFSWSVQNATEHVDYEISGSRNSFGFSLTFSTARTGVRVECTFSCNGSDIPISGMTFDVSSSITPGVTISGPSTSFCAGTNVSFTATPQNGAIASSYSWKVGNNIVQSGSSSPTFSINSLVNGDVVSVILLTSQSCVSQSSATSQNSITVSVTQPSPVTISISPTKPSVCPGEGIGFSTFNVQNAGSNPSYKWYVNDQAATSDDQQMGDSYFIKTNWTYPNNAVVKCVLTSNQGCVSGNPKESNLLTVPLNTPQAFSVNIAPLPAKQNQTYCNGEVYFVANANHSVASYQWYKNGVPVGSNLNSYAPVSYASGDAIKVVATATVDPCLLNTTAEATSAVTIRPNVSISQISGTSSFCQGLTTSQFSASAYDADSVRWTIQNAGSSHIDASGLVNWDPTFHATATITFTAKGCGSPATSSKQVIVNQFLGPVTVSVAATKPSICPREGIAFNTYGTQNIGSDPQYQWFINNQPVTTDRPDQGLDKLIINDWSNRPNNSSVVCRVTSNLGCVSNNPKDSDPIYVPVKSPENYTTGINVKPDRADYTYCRGEIFFEANPSHPTSSYQWYRNGAPTGTNSVTYIPTTFVQGDIITLTATAAPNGCLVNTSANGSAGGAPIVIKPDVAVTSISCSNCPQTYICGGTTSSNFVGTPIGYTSFNWSIANAGTSTINSSTGVTTWDQSFIGFATISITAQGCNGPATTSKQIEVKQSHPEPSLTLSGSQFVCPGAPVTFQTVNETNAGLSPTYKFFVDGNEVSSVGSGTPAYVLAITHWNYGNAIPVKCVMTTSNVCVQGNTSVPSNTITVYTSLQGTVTISPSTSTSCQGDGLPTQFTASPQLTNYVWQLSGAGGGSTISQQGLATWDLNHSGSAFVNIYAENCPSASVSYTYFTNPAPSTPAPQNISACNWEFIELQANSSTASTNWYNAQNNVIATGASLTLGHVYDPVTFSYYVEPVSLDGCKSLSKGLITLAVTDDCEDRLNWTHSTAFDNESNIVSSGKNYFDFNGGLIQSQSKTFENSKILASQTLKDRYDRAVLSTLAAPTAFSDFRYDLKFAWSSQSRPYDYRDFDRPSDEATAMTSTPIDGSRVGSLGWYYSNNNSWESNVPSTGFPFSQADLYDDGTGQSRAVGKQGEVLKLGGGHEAIQGVFPVYNVLDDYLQKRTQVFPNIVQGGSLFNEGIQNIVRDENGNYSISVSEKSGKTVMTCRAGTQSSYHHEVTTTLTSNNDPTSGHYRPLTYFYILEDQAVNISGSMLFVAQNIVTNEKKSPGQTFETNGKWPAGFYRIILTGDGQINLSFVNRYLDVSYQYFDDAGRLRTSVSPNGFTQWPTAGYSLLDKSTYSYDHEGRLLSLFEPDAGVSNYKYRNDGKIRFSQNALQLANENASNAKGKFSYTNYDRLGRPIESGQYIGTAITFASRASQVDAAFSPTASEKNDWLKTYYDEPGPAVTDLSSSLTQEFLFGAVSWTENVNIQTWYSYDEFGRVTWVAQRPKALAVTFVTEYKYDFLGKVKTVINSRHIGGHAVEVLYHHYEYDQDQRLKEVYTSTNGTSRTLRAKYKYYLHGPLKRIELGNGVQGIDFIYNINGWLTQINHPENMQDPGQDGQNGSAFSKDAFGMLIDYYETSLIGVSTGKLQDPNLFHRIPQLSGQPITSSGSISIREQLSTNPQR